MFPVSIEGEFPVSGVDPAHSAPLLNLIEKALREERASTISRTPDVVSFTVSAFRFGWNWNVLVPVESGTIEVVPGSPPMVRYRFDCVRLLVIATLGAFWLASVPLLDGALSIALIALVFFWLWLFGVNYLFAAIRLPRFVKRAVRELPDELLADAFFEQEQ